MERNLKGPLIYFFLETELEKPHHSKVNMQFLK